MARAEEVTTEDSVVRKRSSVLVSVVHAIRVLGSGDRLRKILDFQVRLQQFNVHDFALGSVSALCADQVQRNIPVVCLDEPVH